MKRASLLLAAVGLALAACAAPGTERTTAPSTATTTLPTVQVEHVNSDGRIETLEQEIETLKQQVAQLQERPWAERDWYDSITQSVGTLEASRQTLEAEVYGKGGKPLNSRIDWIISCVNWLYDPDNSPSMGWGSEMACQSLRGK